MSVTGHVNGTVSVEKACLRFGIQLFDRAYRIVIEGRVDNTVFPVLALCKFQDLFLDLLIKDDAGLDLDVDQQPGGLKKIENLFHCRDLYALVS